MAQAKPMSEPGFWSIIPLKLFRKKDDVDFRGLPMAVRTSLSLVL